jgi:predicted MFS family arabinose efflux permease
MVYGAFLALLYVTKSKHSNDSFFTQVLTWLLLALGSHAVTGCNASSHLASRF